MFLELYCEVVTIFFYQASTLNGLRSSVNTSYFPTYFAVLREAIFLIGN